MPRVNVVCFTCDKYSQLIPGFMYFFNKYWPDCPWPLEIVTGTPQPWLEGLDVWYYGDDEQWGANAIEYLEQTEASIIVLLLDDYYLSAPARTNVLQYVVRLMDKDRSVGYVNLRSWSDDVLDGRLWTEWQADPVRPFVGEYDKETAEYLLSLQPGVWRTAFLRGLLREGEDGWQTETGGTRRARTKTKRMLAYLGGDFPLPYVNLTHCGMWNEDPSGNKTRGWLIQELEEEHLIVKGLDEMLKKRIR